MSYRYHQVIPANYVSTSMPEGERDRPGRLKHKLQAPICDQKPQTHSQSMTAAGILFFIAGAAGVFAQLNLPVPADIQEAKQQAFQVFPIFGAVLVSAGICLLHNVREGKEKIAGRVIFALLAGVVGPFVAEFCYPPIIDKVSDIRLQLGLGVIFGGIGYIFSMTFVEKFFKVAPAVADGTVNHLARTYGNVPKQTEKLEK